MRSYSLVSALLLSFVLVLPALAHDPFIEEEDWGSFDAPKSVADSSISYALYGYLDEADVDVFQLDFTEADALLRVEVLAPVCGDHYLNFYPQFAILTATENVSESLDDLALPFETPADLAVLYSTLAVSSDESLDVTPEATAEARETFVEPFGGTAFYQGPKIDLKVPAAGSYYVAVFNNNAMTGDYTLATGYKEEFNSPADQMLQNVQAIRSGEWLHRRCDLSPDDPDAVIEHEHRH